MATQDLLRKNHEAIRNKVGFFSFSQYILEVTGSDSRDFLNHICVNVISELKPNTVSHTLILDEDANVIDDLVVFYHKDGRYWITSLFIDELVKWLTTHIKGKDVVLKDITDQTTLYSVQGPNSKATLDDLLNGNVDNLEYFEFKPSKLGDIDILVSRTGFTGELGYELYFHPEFSEPIVEALREKGAAYEIREIGRDADLTSLAIEKGYIKANDFKGFNPIELGLNCSVDCEKDFIGREKLCRLMDQAPKRKLVGFSVEGKSTRVEKGNKVMFEDQEIGQVITYTYGYTLEKYIGYLLIDSQYASEETRVKIYNGEKEINATVENRVFYDPKGVRVRG